MALEEALDTNIPDDELGAGLGIPEQQAEILRRIQCSPKLVLWTPPQGPGIWPKMVTVFGRKDQLVLFHAGLKTAFGVGKLRDEAILPSARVYPSLARALFAFSQESEDAI